MLTFDIHLGQSLQEALPGEKATKEVVPRCPEGVGTGDQHSSSRERPREARAPVLYSSCSPSVGPHTWLLDHPTAHQHLHLTPSKTLGTGPTLKASPPTPAVADRERPKAVKTHCKRGALAMDFPMNRQGV